MFAIMHSKKLKFICLFLIVITTQIFANDDPNMQVIGLLKNEAIVLIDGQRKVLKIGDTTSTGYTLIEANSHKAIFSYKGKKSTYTLSTQINSTYTTAQPKEETYSKVVRIPLDKDGKYVTTAKINGKPINVLIDTGANTVTLSEKQAKQLKIDYAKEETVTVNTAGGNSKGFLVMLNEITLSGIKVKDVNATILEGEDPKIALLGMTFLSKVSMKFDEKTQILEIGEKLFNLSNH
jgi:aspartyl protease family protein